jgi:transcriptional regulator with XRE-family HTH domain
VRLLVALARRRGLNVTALCRKAGVGRSTFDRIANGRTRSPEPATLAKIAAALGIPSEQLARLLRATRARS